MDPVSGMLLGGAAIGGLNTILGGAASAADAAIQYHYAKKMYSHRYQWAMKDMKKAGLNPVLAANGGSVAGMSSAPSTNFADSVGSGVSAALNAAKSISDLEAQQVSNQKTEADKNLSEANAELVRSKQVAQDVNNKFLEPRAQIAAEKAQSELSLANSAATIQSARARWASDMANAENYGKQFDAMNKEQKWNSMYEDIKRKERENKGALSPKMANWWHNAESYSKVIKNISSLWKFL